MHEPITVKETKTVQTEVVQKNYTYTELLDIFNDDFNCVRPLVLRCIGLEADLERFKKLVSAAEEETEDARDATDNLRTDANRRIAVLEDRIRGLLAVNINANEALKNIIDIAHKHGWNGVENSKLLTEFLNQRLDQNTQKVCTLEKDVRDMTEVAKSQTDLAESERKRRVAAQEAIWKYVRLLEAARMALNVYGTTLPHERNANFYTDIRDLLSDINSLLANEKPKTWETLRTVCPSCMYVAHVRHVNGRVEEVIGEGAPRHCQTCKHTRIWQSGTYINGNYERKDILLCTKIRGGLACHEMGNICGQWEKK